MMLVELEVEFMPLIIVMPQLTIAPYRVIGLLELPIVVEGGLQ